MKISTETKAACMTAVIVLWIIAALCGVRAAAAALFLAGFLAIGLAALLVAILTIVGIYWLAYQIISRLE